MAPLTPLDTIGVIAVAEQTVCDDGVDTAVPCGGFTITVAVMAEPVQPFDVGVMVKVTVTGVPVVFDKIPAILPEPLDAIPVTQFALFLVQL